jgi:hypothetical protein
VLAKGKIKVLRKQSTSERRTSSSERRTRKTRKTFTLRLTSATVRKTTHVARLSSQKSSVGSLGSEGSNATEFDQALVGDPTPHTCPSMPYRRAAAHNRCGFGHVYRPRLLFESCSYASRTCMQTKARRKLLKKTETAHLKHVTDQLYAKCLSLRTVPLEAFLGYAPPEWELTITSINERKLHQLMGLSIDDRNQIEGLNTSGLVKAHAGIALTEVQIALRVIARVAANPPPEVGRMQQKTASKLLRPFPLG